MALTISTAMAVAAAAALASGLCFAVASVLQQRAAATTPPKLALKPALLVELARRPLWLAGIAAAALSFLMQAVALHFGPLTLVQPLIVTELVFAVPLAAWLGRRRLGPREWVGTLAVVAGIGVFLVMARPHEGNPDPEDVVWVVIAVLLLIVVGGVAAARRHPLGPSRATLLAVAAGTLFGLQSALLKTVTFRFGRDVVETFTSWHPYALAVVAVLGLLCSQSAFQAGPVAFSLPVIDALEPAVAILIGAVAFGEKLSATPEAVAMEVLGGVILVAGIFVLDRSPLILSLQQPQLRT